ncbi:TRAFAC clade GTPase domain-containing protein [Actinosynnema sp. CA-299493]
MGGVAGILVLGLVVLLVIALYKRRRARRESVPPDPPSVPRFRVVALGVQGSGKTLLLTALYRRLQVPGDRGFYLKVPFAQLIELNRWYREVASTDDDWPSGTTRKEMREFDFSVVTNVGDGDATVFDLGYLEYPGELLTDPEAPGSDAQQRLLTAVQQADALVGIIDGFQLRQAYDGDRRAVSILQTTLGAMVHCLLTARAPVVFVITKWDLLDHLHADENTRLRMARDVLMGIDGFRDLVAAHGARRVVRLVPVTAVGHDFAFLDHGVIRKKPDGRFQPANVEVALSAVVPDVLLRVELSLDTATRRAIMAEAQRRTAMGPAEALRTLGAFLAQRVGKALVSSIDGGMISGAALALFLESRTEPQPGVDRRGAALGDADRRAEGFVQARRRVVMALQHQVAVLEARLPASRVRSGD